MYIQRERQVDTVCIHNIYIYTHTYVHIKEKLYVYITYLCTGYIYIYIYNVTYIMHIHISHATAHPIGQRILGNNYTCSHSHLSSLGSSCFPPGPPSHQITPQRFHALVEKLCLEPPGHFQDTIFPCAFLQGSGHDPLSHINTRCMSTSHACKRIQRARVCACMCFVRVRVF